MSAGPFAAIAGVARVAELWMIRRPVRTIRNRRRAKRGLPPLTDEDAMQGEKLKLGVLNEDGSVSRVIERTEPAIAARTSTKTGASAIAVPVVAVLGILPFYDQASAFVQEVCAQPRPLDFLVAAGVGWAVTASAMFLTARKTKSPIEPGKI